MYHRALWENTIAQHGYEAGWLMTHFGVLINVETILAVGDVTCGQVTLIQQFTPFRYSLGTSFCEEKKGDVTGRQITGRGIHTKVSIAYQGCPSW